MKNSKGWSPRLADTWQRSVSDWTRSRDKIERAVVSCSHDYRTHCVAMHMSLNKHQHVQIQVQLCTKTNCVLRCGSPMFWSIFEANVQQLQFHMCLDQKRTDNERALHFQGTEKKNLLHFVYFEVFVQKCTACVEVMLTTNSGRTYHFNTTSNVPFFIRIHLKPRGLGQQ